ncbi:MAG: hypothetical protein HZA02_08770 [Nitrospinae bacterium]|nr:hypothetical protein [Nitrospinota bacterium]
MAGKVCPKCGHERRPGDYAPESECPRCGIVYAKVENPRSSEEIPATPSLTEQLVRRKEKEMEESRAGDLVLSCVTAAFIGVFFYLAIWRFPAPFVTFSEVNETYGEFIESYVSPRNFFLAALSGLLFAPAIYKYIRNKRSSWRN